MKFKAEQTIRTGRKIRDADPLIPGDRPEIERATLAPGEEFDPVYWGASRDELLGLIAHGAVRPVDCSPEEAAEIIAEAAPLVPTHLKHPG